jgi:polyribonucleotide nucleotidyltransferase
MKETIMFDTHRVEIDWAGRQLVLETGRMARQADGAVLASYGETTVLATVVSGKEPRDFQPSVVTAVSYTDRSVPTASLE